MQMDTAKFLSLALKKGETIHLINERGASYVGTYENEFNVSTETFKFQNFSTGRTEVIHIEKLQVLARG